MLSSCALLEYYCACALIKSTLLTWKLERENISVELSWNFENALVAAYLDETENQDKLLLRAKVTLMKPKLFTFWCPK